MRSRGAENLVGGDLLRMAAAAMRSVLVDHARRRQTKKRQLVGHRVTLDDVAIDPDDYDRDILAVDRALAQLSKIEPQWRMVVELRFFGGCSESENNSLALPTRRPRIPVRSASGSRPRDSNNAWKAGDTCSSGN